MRERWTILSIVYNNISLLLSNVNTTQCLAGFLSCINLERQSVLPI